MKKAYIVLAHRYPEQLLRLLQRLDDNNSAFFIHIDKRASISDFYILNSNVLKNKIHFIDREVGNWGGVGIVKATLKGMKSISKSKINFDFISLISGQDYPLKSNKEIDRFFALNEHKIFIAHRRLPTSSWNNGGMDRISKYYFGDRLNPDSKSRFLMNHINRFTFKFDFLKRKLPNGIKPYGGSQWWTISRYALDYILHIVQKDPSLLKFHRFSLLPDEMFFQTLFANSEDTFIKENLVNDNLRFIDWSNPNEMPSIFRKKDFNVLTESNKMFARKFDSVVDSGILDVIDQHILNVL